MLEYKSAHELAEIWVRAMNESNNLNCVLVDEATITKPYGWVFNYQSRQYLETGNICDMLLGNAPFLVNRYNGEIRVFGTADTIETYLEEYESTIPTMWLESSPMR